MKVALVHDWLLDWGGAENVIFEIAKLYPQAPIYTALQQPNKWPLEVQQAWKQRRIISSFLQRIPGAQKHYQKLLPLMPLAFESFDLSGYELVISSSHACAKGVITAPHTPHISYIHTPLRYAWDLSHEYLNRAGFGSLKKALAHSMLHHLRLWDQANSQRIDYPLANSHFVAQRLRKYHRIAAQVLHPPVHIPQSPPHRQPQDYFLYAGRLVSYKRVDLLVQTFNANGRPLVIIGDGPERKHLQRQAQGNIRFLGRVDTAELHRAYAEARALLFPPLEDFGIVPVEAMAHGCPVIALGAGGALDTVIHGETGLHFTQATQHSLQAALDIFEYHHFDPAELYRHAQHFSAHNFRSQFQANIQKALAESSEPRGL